MIHATRKFLPSVFIFIALLMLFTNAQVRLGLPEISSCTSYSPARVCGNLLFDVPSLSRPTSHHRTPYTVPDLIGAP